MQVFCSVPFIIYSARRGGSGPGSIDVLLRVTTVAFKALHKRPHILYAIGLWFDDTWYAAPRAISHHVVVIIVFLTKKAPGAWSSQRPSQSVTVEAARRFTAKLNIECPNHCILPSSRFTWNQSPLYHACRFLRIVYWLADPEKEKVIDSTHSQARR